MKKWYKICPFCANEIKEWAKKCQFCKEFLEEWINWNINNDGIKNENWIIWNVLVDTWELIKILLWLWEKRMWAWKWIFLYIFSMFFFFVIFWLIASASWINIAETEEINIYGVMYTLSFVIFLWWYILPKRALDHWLSWWHGLIPIYNIFIFLSSWNKTENKYWKKPSFINSIKSRFAEKSSNGNISKYCAIFIVAVILFLIIFFANTLTK